MSVCCSFVFSSCRWLWSRLLSSAPAARHSWNGRETRIIVDVGHFEQLSLLGINAGDVARSFVKPCAANLLHMALS